MGLRHHVRDAWHELLHGVSPRIALADGGDERVVAAAIRLAESRLISPVLVGPKGASAAAAARLGVGVDVVECDIDTDPLWRAMELVNEADALGCVAGAGPSHLGCGAGQHRGAWCRCTGRDRSRGQAMSSSR